ncbi:MAG: hypothetical protein J7L55_05955, partial [Desulfurococcales archaeon]|nr:hypothetical protein [Desulfurococcales archaeon]
PHDITDEFRGRAKNSEGETPEVPPKLRVREFLGIEGVRRVKASGKSVIFEYSSGIKYEVNVSRNPRIVEEGQVRFIAHIIRALLKTGRQVTMRELRDLLSREITLKGFSAFTSPVPPDLTEVDPLDVIWVLNRALNLKVIQQ